MKTPSARFVVPKYIRSPAANANPIRTIILSSSKLDELDPLVDVPLTDVALVTLERVVAVVSEVHDETDVLELDVAVVFDSEVLDDVTELIVEPVVAVLPEIDCELLDSDVADESDDDELLRLVALVADDKLVALVADVEVDPVSFTYTTEPVKPDVFIATKVIVPSPTQPPRQTSSASCRSGSLNTRTR